MIQRPIPSGDAQLLATEYDRIPDFAHPVHNAFYPKHRFTNHQFIKWIDDRIYEEWCIEHPQQDDDLFGSHFNYRGQGYDQFIAEETHYALESQGFIWDDTAKRFSENGRTGEHITAAYPRTRELIVRALAARSFGYLWMCGKYPTKGDPTNLRAPLANIVNTLESIGY